ncbi:Predicted periplasmic ligand-binding sensor domain [Paramagnetospirillum magneticum AMB-1]|uniref:histidine kinase n=1 Tax=Paramagnetospirillum magneticum (strain ATCC 700264 / AMB-1) TaxID=342108 RepID=Q2W9M1_PARM1|nr:Predicted periplasmic ligand-binding sensor domain [Paramagnetospirillum magneticum AMB-1]
MGRFLLLSLGLFLVVGAFFCPARAEAPRQGEVVVPPVFSHLTPADGLPYPVALGVAQDRHGFIWAATPGGAARWDGYRMTVFRHDSNDPKSLPENIVTNALTDEHGQVWLGTASGLIVRYDDNVQGFTTFRDDRGVGLGRPNAMAGDGRGGIWVASRLALARLDVATKVWRRETGIPAGDVGSVMVDRSGRLWAGTVAGLMRQREDRQSFEPLTMPGETTKDMVSAIFEGHDGTIWFGTRRGRVGKVLPNGEVELEAALPPSGHRVTAFAEPRPGILWVGQYGGGIYELRAASHMIRSFTHDPAIATGLGDNSVTGLLVDRSGLVWVSTLRGVHRHIPGNDSILTLVADKHGGLPGPDVRSVAASADGAMWLGLRAEGLALVDRTANVIRTIPSGGQPDELPPGANQAIAETADGMVWAGQFSGLFRIDTASGKAGRYEPLDGSNILALRPERDHLWAGGSMGLARIDPGSTELPKIFHFDGENRASLSDNSAQTLFRDSAGRLWVGTWKGLNLLEDEEIGRFRRFLNDPEDPESLPSDIVNGICEDRRGRIWVATANGIGVFDPQQPGKTRFTRLGRHHGLPSGTVLSVIAREDGGIVAGTGDGLSLVDQETFTVRTFGPAEGMHVRTFWAGSATRLADGTLGLGGFGGLAMLRPGPLAGWNFRPPVMVTELRIGGQVVPPTDNIVVRPEEGGFQVDFSALDFSAPESNRYAYRLVGNDAEWAHVDAHHRTAGYTHLPPGSFRLELRASNSAGVWNDPPTSLNVRILPEWHQTLWFRVLASAAVLATLFAAERARRAYHWRREQYLNDQIATKTAEAEAAKMWALAGEEEAHRAKEAAEAAAQLKSRFLAIIGHEIRTPLNGLLGMLQLLDVRGLEPGQRELLVTAKDAGETLRDLVESVLEYGRDGARRAEITLKDTELRLLANEIMGLVRQQAELKSIALTLRIEPEGAIWVRCDPIRLSRILINLLGNAVKFTERGEVALNIAAVPENHRRRLTIEVKDTGIGIAPDLRDAIFGDFIQADDTITRKYGGAGLGLAISRRMAEHMGGELSVESTLGMGSKFRLTLLADAGEAPVPGKDTPPQPTDSLHVLVVDDDEINRRVAALLLLNLGHAPVVVTNGEDAIATLSAGTAIDAILMDIRMPKMDGMETTRRIRRWEKGRDSRIRIIAMTADLTDEIWQQCEIAGMDCGLSKPTQLDRLRQALGAPMQSDPSVDTRHGPVDLEFVKMQMDTLGPREMIRLARLFQVTSRGLITDLKAAADLLDRGRIEALAHRLRSATGPLGLVGIADLAGELEAKAGVETQEQLRAKVALLRQSRRASLKGWAKLARQIT